jgi:hypothetical protein
VFHVGRASSISGRGDWGLKGGALCNTCGASQDYAQPCVPEGRSSQIAPASPAGLSAPIRHVAELSRTN